MPNFSIWFYILAALLLLPALLTFKTYGVGGLVFPIVALLIAHRAGAR